MPRREIEGDWFLGWADRKRLKLSASKDQHDRVINGRTPFLEQEGLITPTDATHVVAQLQIPEPVHPDDYSFEVFGEVDEPATYSLADLRRLPGHTVRAVIECAGNDTSFWDYLKGRDEGLRRPKPSYEIGEGGSMDWRGTADKPDFDVDAIVGAPPLTCYLSGGEWTGVRLRDVLRRTGITSRAVAVRLEGFDEGRPDPTVQYLSVGRSDYAIYDPGVIKYDKGLPIEKALDADTILAWAHNGEWLTHVHGAPLRLVVPG